MSRTETVLPEVMTSYGDLEPAPSDPGQRERISWFVDPTVTATGVTAQLHAATTTWPQARAAGHALSDAAPYCASVIDHGTAALLVFQSPPLRAGQSISFSFVRVPEAGPPTIVARLGAAVPGGPATGSDLDQQPWIVSWP